MAGTTGEGPVLTDAERVDPVPGGGRGRHGAGDRRHRDQRHRATRSSSPERPPAAGVDGVLVVTPYYNRPSQAGLSAHFGAVAAATDLPVVLYDIPVRTGRRIAPRHHVQLAREVPNIVGVKDATGDVAGIGPPWWPRRPTASRSTAATTSLTLPLLAVGGGRRDQRGLALGRPAAGRDGPRVPVRRRRGGPAGSTSTCSSRIDFESTEEYPNPCRPRRPAGSSGLPVGQCRLPDGQPPPPRSTTGPAR